MMKAQIALLTVSVIVLASMLGFPAPATAQEDGGLPTIESHTAGFERLDGFFPLYWDDDAGNLWLEIHRLGSEVLYVNALAAHCRTTATHRVPTIRAPATGPSPTSTMRRPSASP